MFSRWIKELKLNPKKKSNILSEAANNGTLLTFDDVIEVEANVIAMYDFTSSSTTNPLRVKASDPLIVDSEHSDDNGWLIVHNKVNGSHGYIPSEFVAPFHSLYSHAWYHGALSSQEATRILLRQIEFATLCVRKLHPYQNHLNRLMKFLF
ncbi:hypothetical protein ACOME3_003974 [Neoechinorhynchus agilis]